MNWLRGPGAIALALGMGMSVSASFAPSAIANEKALRVEALEMQATALSQQIKDMQESMSAFMPPRPIGSGSVIEVAPQQPVIEVAQSSREAASLNVKIGQLEEQMRVLNGQVEGLQFQMTQMQTFLERLQEDYEFRFGQLEGNGSGKTSAAPQTGSERLTGGAPQTQISSNSQNQNIDLRSPDSAGPDLGSQDAPLVLGAPERPLGTLPGNALEATPGIDLSAVQTGIVNDSDADAQYRAGYEAVVRGHYEFAEDQFRQFVDLFPNHPQAPEAVNWLGEALIQRGAYDEAAEVFFSGFEAYQNSSRAPDLLMKLAVALRGAGEDDTACRTLLEVRKRFPNQPANFNNRLADEMRKAQC